jgi:hypothetical protein
MSSNVIVRFRILLGLSAAASLLLSAHCGSERERGRHDCNDDADCDEDEACDDGYCVEAEGSSAFGSGAGGASTAGSTTMEGSGALSTGAMTSDGGLDDGSMTSGSGASGTGASGTGASGTGASTGTGMGHLPQCVTYGEHACALCYPNGPCAPEWYENIVTTCDGIYGRCPSLFICATSAPTCEAISDCMC